MNSNSFDSYYIKHPNLHLSVIDLYDSHLNLSDFQVDY